MATTASLNLWAIISESKRIINSHSRHFLALSVIFLLPLSFSLMVSPFLFPLLLSPSHSSNIHILLRQTQNPSLSSFSLSLPLLLFILSLFFLSLCALSSITHSVFHAFFGRPVKLPSTLLSIPHSFFPLLTTQIIIHFLFFSLSLPLPLLALFPVPFSTPIALTAAALLLLATLYLRVTWSLSSVIVLLESTWGLQPLRRSASLLNGMKSVAVSSFFFFASLEALLLWSSSALVLGSHGWAWRNWAFVVQIVLNSTLLMLLMLYHAAADTVLYMYCKAIHGELALEIAEEFAWQYVSLPFDDAKVPHVVSVVNVRL